MSDPLRRVRLGISGTPRGLAEWVPALRAVRADVVGVADEDLRAARAAARELGGEGFTSLQDLIAAAPGAVLVASGPALLERIQEAVGAGVSVACVPPLGALPEQLESLARDAEAAGTVAMPALLHRFHPAFAFVADTTLCGDLGPVVQCRCDRATRADLPLPESPEEAARVLEAEAGPSLDLCRWWQGEVLSVSADIALGPRVHGEPFANLICTHPAGASVHHLLRRSRRAAPEQYLVEFASASLSVRCDVRGECQIILCRRGRRPEEITSRVPAAPPPKVAFLDHFLDCVQGAGQPKATLHDYRRIAEILVAARISSRDSAKVALPPVHAHAA